MPLLKKNSKRQGFKLLGALLPPWFHHYVSLYSIAKGVTKTEIIKSPLEKWITENYKIEPISKLVNLISNKVKCQWQEKKCHTENALVDFKLEIETELETKGVPKNYILQILKDIRWKELEK